ncbi:MULTISPECIES: alpha/beta fold hydrolase [Acinetobacter]|jgi:pimeloyl-ACP methyl ester carboxylesterase|uniref:alpha/beta fold hydrolase n=1 Tax=Acinetobacter TaxID=469 RepID=UPI0006626F7A|nr:MULTISPECIES: alpha/beta hydrolase [Acinetobacter]KMV01193.1 alpha/beta hydrolase [Acinetobacter sp. VT 511]MBB4836248.1 pimeloyl-ACP methyl ester carboxylesterase [Acinetobacter schindleri]PUR00306.1 alpha/beta hydrolase [Acinetobacter schindleri]WBX39430.1 alpha/beta hydrolase [Acinetobacter schindleri]
MDLDMITRQCPYADLQLNFHEVGQRSAFPTIILIHGTGGNTDKHFSYIFPMLGIHQRVLSIDLHTPNKADLKVTDFSQQVEALIQHAVAKDEIITVVGYSLGAVIAAQVAASLKQRVARLILLAGWAKTSSVQQLRTVIWQQLFTEQSAALPHFVNYCLYSDDYLSARSEQQVLDLARFVKPSLDAAKQRELNYRIDITSILPEIRAETLIVACREDRMVPVAQAKLLFASISNSRYIEISSGHALYVEAPAEVVQLVNQFSQHPEQYPVNQKIQPYMP